MSTRVRELSKDAAGLAVIEMANDQLRVLVTNYGCRIMQLWAPDREGRMADVVLGVHTPAEYETDTAALGAVVGRVANRIGGACFCLNGRDYPLYANDGPNTLHGGRVGYHDRIFSYEIVENGVRLTYLSPDGEEGFPGNLTLTVDYLLEGNCLKLIYEAVSDQDTLVNITNHSYFNLTGGETQIYGHELRVKADQVAEADDHCLVTGVMRDVTDTAFDFREYHTIGERIDWEDALLQGAGGYDHAYILKDEPDQIDLYEPVSGRCLTISTSLPSVQVYSGNFLGGGPAGKSGRPYEKRDGIALETQYLPNAIHVQKDPQVILKKGKRYHAETSWNFTVRS